MTLRQKAERIAVKKDLFQLPWYIRKWHELIAWIYALRIDVAKAMKGDK